MSKVNANTDTIASNKAEQVKVDTTQNRAISTNSANIAKNTNNIFQNAQDIDFLYGEIDRLDSRVDGIMASTHAINNARPYLNREGQTGFGVGVGYSSGESAVSVGIAHAFTDNLSASFTINATTGSHSSVSAGAGVQLIY